MLTFFDIGVQSCGFELGPTGPQFPSAPIEAVDDADDSESFSFGCSCSAAPLALKHLRHFRVKGAALSVNEDSGNTQPHIVRPGAADPGGPSFTMWERLPPTFMYKGRSASLYFPLDP